MKKRYKNNIILCFGDTHFPYEDPRTLDFLSDINKEYKPDRAIHIGDMCDQYTFSAYPKAPNSERPSEELKLSKIRIRYLGLLFPKLDIMESNHDDRLYRAGSVAGIPKEVILPYAKLIGAPKNWKWHRDLTLTIDATREGIHFRHKAVGTTLASATKIGITTVVGHAHSKQGVQSIVTPRQRIYAVDTGCLISDRGCPFAYNKGSIIRPAKGAVIIIEGIPQIIPLK